MKRRTIGLLLISMFSLASCGGSNANGGNAQSASSVEEIKTATITWKDWDGTILETDSNVAYGSLPTYDGLTPTRQSTEQWDYTFKTWSPALSPVSGDTTYTAVYDQILLKAKITFDLDGGTSANLPESIYVESIKTEYFRFNVTKENYNFRGWSYEGTKVFDQLGNQLATPEIKENMVFKAIYAQDAYLAIKTNMPDAAKVSGEGVYPYNTNVDVSVVTNEGYEFVGWYYNGTMISNKETYKYMMWNDDITLEARFKYVKYRLTVVTSSSDFGQVMIKGDSNYSNSRTATYDYLSTVSISSLTITNEYRFLGWFDEEGDLVETNAVYTFTMPHNDYKLIAKWETPAFKVNIAKNFEKGGTVLCPKDTRWKDTVTCTAVTNNGYTFDGWYKNGSRVSSNETYTFTMPKEDVNLEVRWKAISYSVKYELNGGWNHSSNPEVYTAENPRIQLSNPTKLGNDFLGWKFEGRYVTEIDTSWCKDVTLTAEWREIPMTQEEKESYGIIPSLAADGKSLTYGQYPQTLVSDSSLISRLDSLSPTTSGYYLDESDGTFYYQCIAKPYSSSYSFDDGTPIVEGNKYWFRCEPISWKMLQTSSGMYSVVSEKILDAHRYSEEYSDKKSRTDYQGSTGSAYCNDYSYSEIRTWLNTDFLDTAFAFGSSSIKTTVVDNSTSTTNSSSYNKYTCRSTSDKVYLLSYQDYRNASYGFSSLESRCCKTTDFARARRVYSGASSSVLYNGSYWTRSPTDYSYYAWSVSDNGYPSDSSHVNRENYGVRPALSLSL